ncbi:MAG: hypothetical protein DYG83_06100 [Candidatus Brocadia sp. AMX2]|uniref:DUF5615 family PIN-like protein n=1 Tax=Candidatus Brocadia TaxID=380240 RepID=UPI000698FD14|nr:MAG: hypothetical protein EDM70_04505 [Candidatus Brocadia sp. AMX2]MBC6932177.1 hypothetical protein [Candidatus Brocadia sp.]MBL1169446.1 hypothetical protein [Candidatus Brocadia sp. AMX1]NOG42245.1 DUF5615 family PIN-like protein [Planctomycetota bacterium]NUO04208.1 DUF5615 family PIN-like protein [Candidatus Brocadia sinica]
MFGSNLYEVCCKEKRCLVTLDLDFADVTRFPPGSSSGIVVIRIHRNPSFALLEQLVRQFLQALTQIPLRRSFGLLRLVESGFISRKQKEANESYIILR